mmetsp:Transcript_7227/g.16384  ORF Transcript_7227/g.16384 Transcript_7227/m.16384 type:complete len:224 (+) Transcript_7227:376-1047(+)
MEPVKKDFMELIHFLLIELNFLHELIHGLFFGLLMKCVKLSGQLDELPVTELWAIICRDLGCFCLSSSLPCCVQPFQQHLAFMLRSRFPAEGLQELQQFFSLNGATSITVNFLEGFRVSLQLFICEASFLLLLPHIFQSGSIYCVNVDVKVHWRHLFWQLLHFCVDDAHITDGPKLLNGRFQLLSRDAFASLLLYLVVIEDGLVTVKLRLSMPTHQSQKLSEV